MSRKRMHMLFSVSWMALAFVSLIANADPAYVAMCVVCSIVEINAS